MLGLALLIGGAVLGVGLIATFWNEIQAWLKRVVEKVKTVVQGVVQGVRIFFARMQGIGKEISRNYAKVGMKWQETIVKKTVELSEIPEEYRKRMVIDSEEYEFTDELENQLSQ